MVHRDGGMSQQEKSRITFFSAAFFGFQISELRQSGFGNRVNKPKQ
jgi:hypothetical protein